MRIKNISRIYLYTRRQSEEHLPQYKTPDYGIKADDFVLEETNETFESILEKIAIKYSD